MSLWTLTKIFTHGSKLQTHSICVCVCVCPLHFFEAERILYMWKNEWNTSRKPDSLQHGINNLHCWKVTQTIILSFAVRFYWNLQVLYKIRSMVSTCWTSKVDGLRAGSLSAAECQRHPISFFFLLPQRSACLDPRRSGGVKIKLIMRRGCPRSMFQTLPSFSAGDHSAGCIYFSSAH